MPTQPKDDAADEARPRKVEPPPKPEGALAGPPAEDGEEWDEVDESAWESFPASDPPSHWAGPDRPVDEDEA